MILIHACKTSVGRDLRPGSGAGGSSLGEEEVRVGVRNSWDQYVGMMPVKLMKRLRSVVLGRWPCRLNDQWG
jgi:hypothetical protein